MCPRQVHPFVHSKAQGPARSPAAGSFCAIKSTERCPFTRGSASWPSARFILAEVGGEGRRHKTRRLARFLWFSLSKGHKKNPSCKIWEIPSFEPFEFPHSQARGPQSLGFSGSIGRSHRSCLHNYSKNPGGVADFQGIDLCDFPFATFALSSPLKFNILRLDIHKPSASVDLSVPPKICAFNFPAKSLQG